MKKMGFFGVAVAATLRGEVTVELALGLETLRGKSLEPFFHGAVVWSSAGGAGNWLEAGLEMGHVICSGGMEGKFGCGAAGVDGVVLDFEEPVPHAMEADMPTTINIKIRV
ncbi:MAG TPA: hypothetical protein VFO46_01925 [Candidatus Sulfotelmatobacter sp.]|nr:hypothetical protein [Candidatus Sulfotelmatobacter sp.]